MPQSNIQPCHSVSLENIHACHLIVKDSHLTYCACGEICFHSLLISRLLGKESSLRSFPIEPDLFTECIPYITDEIQFIYGA